MNTLSHRRRRRRSDSQMIYYTILSFFHAPPHANVNNNAKKNHPLYCFVMRARVVKTSHTAFVFRTKTNIYIYLGRAGKKYYLAHYVKLYVFFTCVRIYANIYQMSYFFARLKLAQSRPHIFFANVVVIIIFINFGTNT